MTTPAHANKPILINEPVIAAHVAIWALANLGALLIGRTHLVTSTQWGALTSALTPEVTAVILALSAYLTRKYVSPAYKVVQGAIGGLPVVDFNVGPSAAYAVDAPAADASP